MPEDWLQLCRAARDDVARVLASCPAEPSASPWWATARAATTRPRSTLPPRRVILERFRGEDVKLVSEEVGVLGNGRFTVVVDPIDGSLNAKRGIPFFSISIAVAEGDTMDDVVFAYVHDFGAGEEWTAARGGGARLNGLPLTELPKDELEILSFEATTTAYVVRERGTIRRGRTPAAHHGVARDHALPPRRRSRRRCRLAQRGAVGGHRRSSAPSTGTRAVHRPPGVPTVRVGAARSRRPFAGRCGPERGALRPAVDRPARLRRYPRTVPTQEQILAALGRVIDPELRRPVTELDMVRDISIDGSEVSVTIALTVVGCPLRSSFEDQVAEHVGTLPGVSQVALHFDVMSPDERAALTLKLRGGAETKGIRLSPTTRVLAVASGKGGVGKSSLAVNLAAALAAMGQEVGVLDADIYGHSIPHLLGITQKPMVVDKMIVPPVAHDLRLMSIGFFLDDNQPVMWRGPMLHRALEQFLQDVHWGELDVLVVDMPPGTGDVSISLGQLLPRAEAIIVTTPQPLAQEVASRAAVMAQKTGMRVVGVIENMTSEIFGSGGGARLADELGVPMLGSVPLDARLREAGDAGVPLVTSDPESEPALAIAELARAIDASRAGGFTSVLPLVS